MVSASEVHDDSSMGRVKKNALRTSDDSVKVTANNTSLCTDPKNLGPLSFSATSACVDWPRSTATGAHLARGTSSRMAIFCF